MGLTFLFLTAVLLSIVLERQERRHRFELGLEYDRLGMSMPPLKPRLSPALSWLNVVVGIIMLIIGEVMLLSQISMLWLFAEKHPMDPQSVAAGFEFVGVWLATAIALIILGLKSVRQHRHLGQGTAQN